MDQLLENPVVGILLAFGVVVFLTKVGDGIREWFRDRRLRYKASLNQTQHERRLREIEKLDEVLSIMVADAALADTLSDRIEAARARVRVDVEDLDVEPDRKRSRSRKNRKKSAHG